MIAHQYLRGDERIALAGLLPHSEEALSCALPGFSIHAELVAADGRSGDRDLALDTVLIDLDARTVALTWRLTLDQRACIERVRLTGVVRSAPEPRP